MNPLVQGLTLFRYSKATLLSSSSMAFGFCLILETVCMFAFLEIFGEGDRKVDLVALIDVKAFTYIEVLGLWNRVSIGSFLITPVDNFSKTIKGASSGRLASISSLISPTNL